MRDYILASPRPDSFPAHDDIVIGSNGEVLVAEYPGPLGILSLRRADPAPEQLKPKLRVPAHRWLVFDPTGALIATFRSPDGFEPYAYRGDMLWGVHTDELDVESVRAYELSGT